MKPVSLRVWIVGTTAALVAGATLFASVEALRLLRRLAHEEAQARVALAATAAVEALERSGENARRAAELLAGRPTLQRLLAANDRKASREYLSSFAAESGLSGCAVIGSDGPLATAGVPLAWAELSAPGAPPDGRPQLRTTAAPQTLVLVASARSSDAAGWRAWTAIAIDSAYTRAVSAQLGLPVAILDRRSALGVAEDPGSVLRGRAVAGRAPVTQRLGEGGPFAAVAPLEDGAGEVSAVVEVLLPGHPVDRMLARFERRIVVGSVAAALVAALLALWIARRLVRPLEGLTAAAARIGAGDLGSPIPRGGGGETALLATTMERMRDRLVRSTGELERRSAEAEAVLSGILEGVFAVDRERRIRYLNPQAAMLLGVRAEDAVGRFCGDVLRPREIDGVRPCDNDCPILHARFRGSARATERLALGSGARSVVITSAPPSAEANADEPRQFQVLRDETEEEGSRRLRDAVLAGVSHEFRTPLSAQLASIELLRDRLPELRPEELLELLQPIERGTLRLTRLIDNLLESLRIESGDESIRRRPVALDQVVEEAVELTRSLIAQKEQTLDVRLPYPLPEIEGDAPRLGQVLVNLLANANKFAPAGSAITLGGAVREGEILLWVEDRGPGLPPDADEHLFERFNRALGEEPEERGMGLGLWIVRSIVERHGGRVEAHNTGGGARFEIVLPRGVAV